MLWPESFALAIQCELLPAASDAKRVLELLSGLSEVRLGLREEEAYLSSDLYGEEQLGVREEEASLPKQPRSLSSGWLRTLGGDLERSARRRQKSTSGR